MILMSKENLSLAGCIVLATGLALVTGDSSILTATVVVGLAIRVAGGMMALAFEPIRD